MDTSHSTPEQQAGPPPYPNTPLPQPESGKFFQWLRNLGINRSGSRWVGGVCSGLAARWGIDPVIVRGLAVVLTLFFGVGLLVYGVAWALLPEPDGRIHAEEAGRGHWSTGMSGAAALIFLGVLGQGPGFAFGRDDSWVIWPIFWLAGIAAVIYWALNHGKAKNSRPDQQQDPSGQGHSWSGQQSSSGDSASTSPRQAPGATGHAGIFTTGFAAPPTGAPGLLPPQFATQQTFSPDPKMYIKHKPAKVIPRLGTAATLVVLGLAAIVGSAVLLLNAAHLIDLNGYQTGVATAAAAVTAGVGIIISGALGRAAGGLSAFAIAALVFAALFSVPHIESPLEAFNTSTWAPASISAAEVGQTVVLGNSTIDLTQITATTALPNDVRVPLDLVVANVSIKVPANIPVTVTSELAAASLTVNGHNDGKILTDQSNTDINQGATGHRILIVLQGAASSINIPTVPARR